MFLGRFQHTIDDKGRLSIPVKFREILNSHSSGTVIITTDFDHCLIAYPLQEWSAIAERVKKLPMMDKGVKNFLRFFYSWATECPLDKQGRVLIPPPLREYASLDRDTTVIGVENKFEIWNPQKWQENETLVSENRGEIAQAMAGLGL